MALHKLCSRGKSIINRLPTNVSTLIYLLLLYHAEHNYGDGRATTGRLREKTKKQTQRKGSANDEAPETEPCRET
jgi:hypothetical protein